jgi:GNAT superfamily N-acetyltransferase
MAQSAPVFVPLAAPLAPKVLAAFRKDAGWTGSDRDALRGAAGPGGRVQWVTVQVGQKTVAVARLELAPPQFCMVSDLIVLASHRGRGIGAWCMGQIERYCIAQGIPRVLLQAEAASRGFYEKLDFVDDPRVAGFLKKELNALRRRQAFGTTTSSR